MNRSDPTQLTATQTISRLSIALALFAGLALRLWWILHYGQTTVDARVYGEFARNLLQHGTYGFGTTIPGVAVTPSLIRLPGYPLFLALCFRLFGIENYLAVMLVQALIDLGTCVLIAALATRLFSRRAGLCALWLAVLCPFTANYVAAPLTETLTLFCIALAFYALERWRHSSVPINRWLLLLSCTLAYAILLRPEQGLLAAAIVPAIFFISFRTHRWAALTPAAIAALLTILPLVPWTVRNWYIFHTIQPLAPRFANDPGERVNYGFQRWYRTWAIDFASTDTIYWNYDGQVIQVADLPNRAFDTQAQYTVTEALFATYNADLSPNDSLDARFNELALERIHTDPIRYYLALPSARVLNMIFRPRTEMLPIPVEWWKFPPQKLAADRFALAYALLNFVFFALAAATLARPLIWAHQHAMVWTMLATILMRIALLLTLDNSEPRYTLEFFPVLLVFGAATLDTLTSNKPSP
jgi:4-amino-4-deoxy-L-arabinose transferase-like glycosyltransferase